MADEVDIVVVGAGAAGLMASIIAGRELKGRKRILLLDSRKKIGAKILISGGTRCNVTNAKVTPKDYHGASSHYIQHVLEGFNPDKTRQFFNEIGVELVLEPTGKYFPTTHSGKTVLEALMREADKERVELKTGVRITRIQRRDGHFLLQGGETEEEREKIPYAVLAKRVILTTGGLSYPETGSDGAGLKMAEELGHSIEETHPSLTPLTGEDEDWISLSGITIDAKISFYEHSKKVAEYSDSFLFTHQGFSGPAALDISRFVASSKKDWEVRISFLPRDNAEIFRKHLEQEKVKHPNRCLRNLLKEDFLLPERLSEVLLRKCGIPINIILNQLGKEAAKALLEILFAYPLPVTGVIGYKKAEVTMGGVSTKEVQVATMESKKTPGLYFAGEILGVDGRIGGFNFQWAWSTGFIAGHSAAKELL